ncbi:MAG: phosphoribosyltransferase family protein [Candidatus Woesearchaeota archaeon]|jgi:predicted phosphoribosyltransferase|nr:phosphoribosyltransferase family protein [Candidatus Woesearchaeota archaeon]MDP6265925.1 phosphoribosyltransferase family protein [Candidatus Woesearchaeota archaeon]MDP7476524.1 phosphoribosyltransferase family protein [Candidatus Woesearchaeota archaeon]
MIFKDRHEAGQQLARELSKYKNKKDVIVLGIPRGGVEVAFNIAKTLKIPLSIVVTKKIGHPFESEFAIGAVSPGGHYSINKQYQAEAGEGYIKNTIKELTKEINRRYKEYTNEKLPKLKNKIVILVDDGLATGFTMLSAVEYAQSQNPKKIIVAIPVAAQDSFEKVKAAANEVVCLQVPVFFAAVGGFYQNFMQLEDEEVKYYLKEAKKYC